MFYVPETEFGSLYRKLERVHPSAVAGESSASGTPFDINKPEGLQYKLYSAKFYIRKYGTPTGTLKAHFYLATHPPANPAYRIPTGSSLAESEAKAIEDLTSNYQLVEFKFFYPNRYIMTSRTWYVIVLEVETGSVVDGSNYVRVALDDTAVDHVNNETFYHTSAWKWDSVRDGIAYVYGEFYCNSCGKFNETKNCIKDAIQSAIPETAEDGWRPGMVTGNWRSDIKNMVRKLPFISVRVSPVNLWDVYDRAVPSATDGGPGSLADYHVSIHVFHSNCNEDGEERGKYAQDVASRIIDYFTVQPPPVGFDTPQLAARESEPARGANRISRVIIEGTIQIKRID